MKKIILVTALLSSGVSMASNEPTASPYPWSKDGINIAPLSKIDPSPKQYTTEGLGYINTPKSAQTVNFMWEIKRDAKKITNKMVQSKYDTSLRSSKEQLVLNFKMKSVPGIAEKDILGYAVAGTYKNGWTGASEYFYSEKLGVCNYLYMPIKSAVLAKERISYEVNNNPTEAIVYGNDNDGFVYDVNWFTDTLRQSIECTSYKFNSNQLDEIKALANQIDKSN